MTVTAPRRGAVVPHRHRAPRGALSWWDRAPLTLLVADPDPDAPESLGRLWDSGEVALVCAPDGADALFQVGRLDPDVLLVSAELPVVSAPEVIAAIRRHSPVPIAVGIAPGQAERAAACLTAGASEVLGRPYRQRELASLLSTHLERAQERRDEQAVVAVGRLKLDSLAYRAWAGTCPVELTVKEFELLRLLMLNADRVVTQAQIRRDVWHGEPVTGNTITVHIRRIRTRIEQVAHIVAVRGVGYRVAALP